ncbi:hypothetical protein STENO_002238 [Stenotrophomonas maltophilia]|uniref:hypothetical protein n=1 Tax=Stenotrophomonas sepilia TaxID=2860290 RepID=UPI002E767878|nr:hypothetical protein [Stenotrophomonas sepilia]
MTANQQLEVAGKKYGECAKQLTSRLANPKEPTAEESELLIAFGIASDWTRRAAALDIDYSSRHMRKASKTPSVSEMIKFGLAWSGMNALFSRNSIFDILGIAAPKSELDRFRSLVGTALSAATQLDEAATNLQNLLKSPTVSYVPGHPSGTALAVLQVLHEKYTPAQYRSMSTGKLIQQAIATGDYTPLDVPTLIYLMRNWSVHGGVMSSSFRSVPRFNSYISIVSRSLALIHVQLAEKLVAATSAP